MTESTCAYKKSNVQSKVASVKAVSDCSNILSIIDKSLKHLNQISEANFVAQDLYIELLKEKKNMKFDQIKKIYFTLTEGKAKQILFERDKKLLMETDYQNHEGLIRLFWRSIEKLIKKITYYMINQNHLSVISKNVLKLIHFNQSFVRRFQKLKNSSMLFIVEITEKLIQENSLLQNKIYEILLNRGYVVSLDEFYKLNGYDAEHRQSYYAKQDQQIVTSSSEDQKPDKQDESPKPSAKNSRNQTIRKNKAFRIDPRYSWKQKIQIQQKKENLKYPADKTNFDIRQSFKNLIEDFLQNQNLNQVLIKYKFSQKNENLQKKEQQTHRLNEVGIMEKKIFEKKIGSVINQLKGKNINASSKLLQIINVSSNQAISSKVGFPEKRLLQNKNTDGKESVITKNKLRQSQLINDRKIINQSFFRELLKKHNQNSLSNVRKSEFSEQRKSEMLVKNPCSKTQENTPSFKSIKSTFRFMETQMNCKYSGESRKIIGQSKKVESVGQKIRIARQEWDIKNERNILEAIENLTIEPSNLMKLTEVLHALNSKKHLRSKPWYDTIKHLDQGHKMLGFIRKNELKYTTIQTELGAESYINKVAQKQLRKINKQQSSNLYGIKRFKTEQSPTGQDKGKIRKRLFLEDWKENNRHYEIYDRRLRRILQR